MLALAPKRLGGMGIAIDDEVTVELVPEGPQRGDLAEDIAGALAADPAAGAFFDTLAQFYRRPSCAGSMRPAAGRICGRPASLRSSACSRRGSKSGRDR